jgi:hypothetical protein
VKAGSARPFSLPLRTRVAQLRSRNKFDRAGIAALALLFPPSGSASGAWGAELDSPRSVHYNGPTIQGRREIE